MTSYPDAHGAAVSGLGWDEQKRVRRSVQYKDRHLGYVTTVSYPNRDITLLSEGTPFSEIVIAGPREEHVALLQRYLKHWLIQCDDCYGIADRGGELADAQAMRIAQTVLLLKGKTGRALVDGLKELIEGLLTKHHGGKPRGS